MEMNTRLQVEHPVTEEVCYINGKPLDLVRLQLQTAAGLPLGFNQENISIKGVCMETRIYAESPTKGFLPVSGKLDFMGEPEQGVQGDVRVRLETGFRSGDDVLIHYDPMIAKLVVWGEDRLKAIQGMRAALNSYHIVGVQTNIEFLKRCVINPSFLEGGVTTNFIESNKKELLEKKSIDGYILALGAVSFLCNYGSAMSTFRLNHVLEQKISFILNEIISMVLVKVIYNNEFICDVNDVQYHINVESQTVKDSSTYGLKVKMNDEIKLNFTSVITSNEVSLIFSDGFYSLGLPPLPDDFGNSSLKGIGSARIVSPMPGKVTKFLLNSGTKVKQGQAILMLEAMKMEHVVKATGEGELSFCVKEGEIVGGEQLLANIIPNST